MNRSDIFARNVLHWGEATQQTVADSCVLVAGVGGLGCAVAELLARAGVGTLLLVDSGVIDPPDLNRQILYTLADVGRPKVDAAAEKLAAIHGQTTIFAFNGRIEPNSPLRDALFAHRIDGIADCFDTFSSRFVLEQYLRDGMFLVHGGIQNDYGQITTIKPPVTKTLRAIYPNAEDACSPIPVCPQIVVCIASLMVNELLKNLCGTPQLLNTLLIVELSDFSFFKVTLQ